MKEEFKKFFEELKGFVDENLILWFFTFTTWLKFLDFNQQLKTFSNKPIFLYSTFVLVLLLYVPFTFFRRKKITAAIVVNLLLIFLILANLVYVRYFNALPTIDNLSQIGNSNEVMDSISALLKTRDSFFFFDLVAVLAFWLIKGRKWHKPLEKQRLFFPTIAVFASLGLLLPIFAVDRAHYLPFYVSRVYDNKMTTERYGLLGAQYLDIYRKATTRTKLVGAEKESAVGEIKENYYKSQAENSFTGAAKGKNIVAIQVESLEASVIGKKVEGKEITPNLNKLIEESHYFSNHYFEMGFGNTSDTDFTFNTSMYPLLDASTFMKYGKQNYAALPKYLIEEGYSANAYHAYNKSFWNRSVAYKSLGYQDAYFSKNFSGSAVGMGINDRDFLAQSYQMAKSKKEPSYNYVVTLSSHFPFALPPGVGNLELDSTKYPASVYNYYRSINYADQALGEFLESYKKDGTYNDTLFVVFGDHFAKKAENVSNAKEDLERKKVPLIIKLPGKNQKVMHKELSSTIDIAPTILNLIGYKKPFIHFGRDLFGAEKPFFAGSVYFGNGVLADEKYTYIMGGTNDISRGECYLSTEWKKVANAECAALLEKRNKDYKYSSSLIKYNLFGEIK